jgi:DNA-binding response OmpR family regulator
VDTRSLAVEPYTILIVARTQSLARRLRATLDAEEYVIRWVSSTSRALDLDLQPSLVILDLPPSGGVRSAAQLKDAFEVPLLALGRPERRIPKPVDASLLRPYRVRRLVDLVEDTLLSHSPHLLSAGQMSLDTEARRLQMNGSLHQLRPLACQILAHLMAHAGEIVPREELFRRVWHTDDTDNTRALDVHIAYLRRELEEDPRHPTLIVTERGVGYRLEPPSDDQE